MPEKIKPDEISFDSLMSQIKDGTVKIPDFQREFVWDKRQILNLLDSIYHQYPIGSFLFWESDQRLCAYRNIGNIELKDAPEGKIHYVLDGQQRITSLFASLEEAEIRIQINGKNVRKRLQVYFDLDKEEFVTDREVSVTANLEERYASIWTFPRTGDYFENIARIVEVIDESDKTENEFTNWFMTSGFTKSRANARYYVRLLNQLGLGITDDSGRIQITYEGAQFLQSRDPALILRLLFRNFLYFDDIAEMLIEKRELDADEVRVAFEAEYEIGWETTEQVMSRFKWFWKLGYAQQSSRKLVLEQSKEQEIKQIISEERENEEKNTVFGIPDEGLRFVSVKQIQDVANSLDVYG